MLHHNTLLALLPLLALMAVESGASPITKREVPQELSHKKYLTATQASLQLDNPAGIVDPVFGLLGNGAAKGGAGTITNLDCLQQATADQAFTNAKAAGDVEGMTAALVYRALERNTLGVGLKSVACTEEAVNPEIAALRQHQDPASEGAAAENKAITLELASQIASVGGDPLVALDAGTFAPGDLNDNTFAGNTCDDANDAEGCIFTRNLLVPDASEAEVLAAAGAAGVAQPAAGAAVDAAAPPPDVAAPPAAAPEVVTPPAAGAVAGGAAGIDVGPCTDFSMSFTGGNDGRPANQLTFVPTDKANFPGQQSALNPNIIANFMCDTFVNRCAKSAATRDVCKTVAADLSAREGAGELKRDQGFADAWLADLETAFGISSTGTGSAGAGGIVEAVPAPVAGAGMGGGAAVVTPPAVDAGAGMGGGAEVITPPAGDVVAGVVAGAAAGGAAGLDVGSCTDFSMTFSGGNDGRAATEFTFIPTDRASFPQGSALNPNIITNAMCDGFVNGCAKSAATRDACKVVAADLAAQEASGALKRDQGFADAWLTALEGALGVTSTGQGSAGAGAGVNAGAGAEAGAGAGAVEAGAGAGAGAAAGLDVGTCTDFSMTFSGGNDGRAATEFTFIPTDRASFPQSSALSPNIITNAMCDGFVNGCAKSAATRDACKVVAADLAAQEASGALKRDQGFADAWLTALEGALGVKSTGQGSAGAGAGAAAPPAAGADAAAPPAAADPAAVDLAAAPPAVDNAAAPPAAGNGNNGKGHGGGRKSHGEHGQKGKGNAGAAGQAQAGKDAGAEAGAGADAGAGAGGAVDVAAGAGAADAGAGIEAGAEAAEAAPAAAVGGNVQSFTGALNGKAAPPVAESAGNRPFSVNGNTFQNIGAAINRSCAIQHNACATAFNTGEGDSNVAACDAQGKECLAAGQAPARVRRSRVFRSRNRA